MRLLNCLRLLVLALLVTAGLTTSLTGISNVSGEIDYYSDETLQNQVGYWIKTCTDPGHDIHYGTATSYWQFHSDGSCGNGGCLDGSAWASVWNNAPDSDPGDCTSQSYSDIKYKGCILWAQADCTSNLVCGSAIIACGN